MTATQLSDMDSVMSTVLGVTDLCHTAEKQAAQCTLTAKGNMRLTEKQLTHSYWADR